MRSHASQPADERQAGRYSTVAVRGPTTGLLRSSSIRPLREAIPTGLRSSNRDPEIHLGKAAWVQGGGGKERTRREASWRG